MLTAQIPAGREVSRTKLGMVVISPHHRRNGAASLLLAGATDKAIDCGVDDLES